MCVYTTDKMAIHLQCLACATLQGMYSVCVVCVCYVCARVLCVWWEHVCASIVYRCSHMCIVCVLCVLCVCACCVCVCVVWDECVW